MIHMTVTSWGAQLRWRVLCRCGWHRSGLRSRHRARKVGDDHLAEANQ